MERSCFCPVLVMYLIFNTFVKLKKHIQSIKREQVVELDRSRGAQIQIRHQRTLQIPCEAVFNQTDSKPFCSVTGFI